MFPNINKRKKGSTSRDNHFYNLVNRTNLKA